VGLNRCKSETYNKKTPLREINCEFFGLGSYLADAYNGDIRRREEVSARLAHDLRQGAHARKVIESYQETILRRSSRGVGATRARHEPHNGHFGEIRNSFRVRLCGLGSGAADKLLVRMTEFMIRP
jgi:hypothetical protein